MLKTTIPIFPTALKQLANWGERLRLARRRRNITAVLFAERMGVSSETLRRLEKGAPTIAIGTYLLALRVPAWTKTSMTLRPMMLSVESSRTSRY